MTHEDLFNQSKNIASQIQTLSGYVQNEYLPTEVNPKEFRNDVDKIVKELREWENNVILHYRNMSKDEQESILATREYYNSLYQQETQ